MTTLTGTVINCMPNDYNGPNGVFGAATMATVPSVWADVSGAVSKTLTKFHNDGNALNFKTSDNFVGIAMRRSTITDMTGSTIVFDIVKLLSDFASDTPTHGDGYGTNLFVVFCQYDSSTSSFVLSHVDGTTTSIKAGDSSATKNTLYVALTRYTLTAPITTVTGVFPYTIGVGDGDNMFGFQADGSTMQFIKEPKDAIVYIRNTPLNYIWVIIFIILAFLILAAIVAVVVYRVGKKTMLSTPAMS